MKTRTTSRNFEQHAPRKPDKSLSTGTSPSTVRILTVNQTEAKHPGFDRRLRQYIHRSDAGDPECIWLKPCIIRIGRSVYINESRFCDALNERSALPAAPSRRK